MTKFDRIMENVREKVARQNFELEMYGKSSIEFQYSKIALNNTLETLEMVDYISDYNFHYLVDKITEVDIYINSYYMVAIREDEVLY